MDGDQVSQILRYGLTCQQQGRWMQAADAYRTVLLEVPRHPRALHLLALVLATQGQAEEAKALLLESIQIDPDVTAISNLAKIQLGLGELGAALDTVRRGMAVRPAFAPLYCTEGIVYLELGRPEAALTAFECGRMVDALSVDAQNGIKRALSQLGETPPEGSLPQGFGILDRQGFYLREGEQFYDAGAYHAALSCLGVCLAFHPENLLGKALYVLALMHACQWEEIQGILGDSAQKMQQNEVPIPPFAMLALIDEPVMHLRCTQKFFFPSSMTGIFQSSKTGRSRIPLLATRPKIAYVSGDFHDHATSRLMVDMLEAHDRQRWEIIGVSFGPDEDTAMRKRMQLAFERFLDVRAESDEAVVQMLTDMQVDVVIDVKGLTEGCRERIFLERPAPVIVNFLAYPGSMGVKVYDYILGDAVVTPFSDAPNYDECIIQLPGTYQCNGPNRPLPIERPDRRLYGLPENVIVFAAFNNTYKIQQAVFEVWMRILTRVTGSVLWLTCDDALTQASLRQCAASFGVDGSRVLFASKMPWREHLFRLQCADLFLDTWPYNAHTTASDALWMGLPLLTRSGASFASRVAASLLTAMGLSELITHDVVAYEDLAVHLALNPIELNALRERICSLRDTSQLFDSQRFAKNLEQAFSCMIARSQSGLSPGAFAVRDVFSGGGYRLQSESNFSPVPEVFTMTAK